MGEFFNELNYSFSISVSERTVGSIAYRHPRRCFEFVSKSENNVFGIGFAYDVNHYVRYESAYSYNFGRNGIDLSISGPKINVSVNEPALMCIKHSPIEITLIKDSDKSTARSADANDAKWRLFGYNNGRDQLGDIELHLTKSSITSAIPYGYKPWISIREDVTCNCKRKNYVSLYNIVIMTSFS